MHRPGVELAVFRLQVRRPNHYTTEPLHDDHNPYKLVVSQFVTMPSEVGIYSLVCSKAVDYGAVVRT